MTTTQRVSDHKGTLSGAKKNDGKPKPGTKLREAYDALRTGQVVSLRAIFGDSASRSSHSQLRDFYGMDIEPVREGGRVIGSRLVGEWDGPYYVPIERLTTT